MLSALREPGPSSLITYGTSLTYLRILMTPDSVCGIFISTRRLRILSRKLCVCDMDVISQEDLVTYESLVQEATREYRDLVDSKWWEPTTSKENSQDQPSLPKVYTVAIEESTNKTLKKIDLKSHRSGNDSGSVKVSSARSDITCHKCGKKGHIKKDCRPKGNGSSGNTPNKSTNELPYWVTMKPAV